MKTEEAFYSEIYLEEEGTDYGFDGWCIYFPRRKLLFVLIPETEREEQEKYIEQVEQELKKDNVLPEGYNIIVCYAGNIYNVGTCADELENSDDL